VKAEDLFAYVYGLLASPEYVTHFSEELTNPGPRIPITKDVKLFETIAKVGRHLIWLHTYGERFVPKGKKTGTIPHGMARCIRGISESDYPERYSYDVAKRALIIGDGRFAPVSKEAFDFSVSGFKVVQSWLAYRMKEGAGKKSSLLDKIRPERWTAEMTQELLELLWVLEETIDMYPQLAKLLDQVVESETFNALELPQPEDEERKPPQADDEEVGDPKQISATLTTE